MRLAMLYAAVVLAALTSPAGAEAPAWVHEAVVPMVGPFSKDSGPKGKTPEQILEDFRPEIAEWSFLPRLAGHPLCPKGVLGGLEYQEYPQSPERDYKLWEEQFGAKFEPNEECGVAVPSSGQIAGWKYGSDQKFQLWFTCHNSPRWHAFHRASILRCARDKECALIRQDNIGVPCGVVSDNGGWCRWCLGGFRERLRGRFTAAQLKTMGIEDVGAADLGALLRARIASAKPEALVEDPLVREYARHLLKTNLDAWRDEVEGAHAIRKDVPICGNQGSGELWAYPTVLLSDAGDLIFLENSRRQYPDNPNSLNYALALAGGRHSKPAWIWDFGIPEYMEQVDHSLLFVAECYANGAVPYYEMNNLAHSSKKGYYAIALGTALYDALANTARFAREHRDLLTRGYWAEAPVGILYSVPSFAPKVCGAARLGGAPASRQAAHLSGFARFLEQSHIPYNVEILGDDELWPDRDLPQRLARYPVLAAPNVEALTDAQAEALAAWMRRGGVLVASGELGTRDGSFARRARPALAPVDLGKPAGRVVSLGDAPEEFQRSRASGESRGASQTVVLDQAEAKPLVVRGWSRCRGVSGAPGSDYSLYLDLVYTDGTPLWAQTATFKTGTHDWQMAETTIYPSKPIRSATVHALFRYRTGTAWFDDLFIGVEGSDVNLLKNPGLEGGDGKQVPGWDAFLGWQRLAAGYVPETGEPHGGAACIRCDIPKAEGSSAPADALRRAFGEALRQGDPVQTDAPATLFIRPVRKGGRMVVHLLNYDYDGGQERMNPTGAFHLSLRLPGSAKDLAGDVLLATPDQPGPDRVIPHRVRAGRLELDVPPVRVWSVLRYQLPGKSARSNPPASRTMISSASGTSLAQ